MYKSIVASGVLSIALVTTLMVSVASVPREVNAIDNVRFLYFEEQQTKHEEERLAAEKAEAERIAAEQEAARKAEEARIAAEKAEAERIAAEQVTYQQVYYEPQPVASNYGGQGNNFRSDGVWYDDSYKYTYYSSNVLRHYRTDEWTAGDDGIYRDSEGYVVVASNDHPQGTVIKDTLFGDVKVYDSGCDSGTLDVYTNF